jgi:hyperosmotically inducible periplasmic protein
LRNCTSILHKKSTIICFKLKKTMNKLTSLLLGSLLLLGAVACDNNTARTNPNAPDPNVTAPQAPSPETARDAKEDATSDVRRAQLDADIRAREQRDQALGTDGTRADTDLASQVRSKLEANLPASLLTVTSENGVVTVTGTVPTQQQYNRIEPLAKEIRGVQRVNVQAKVAPAKK